MMRLSSWWTFALTLGFVPALAIAEPPRRERAIDAVESTASRRARQALEREAAGGNPEVWAIAARIAMLSDEVARELGLPLPEVVRWYRPPGRCAECSSAHSRGGVDLEPPVDLAARHAFARALSRRLGRHHRVTLIELGADPGRELHTNYRDGEEEGHPFSLRRVVRADVLTVAPDPYLPPPLSAVYGDPEESTTTEAAERSAGTGASSGG